MRTHIRRTILTCLSIFICVISFAKFMKQVRSFGKHSRYNITNIDYEKNNASSQKFSLHNKVIYSMYLQTPKDTTTLCQKKKLLGRLLVNTTSPELSTLESEFSFVRNGGWWYPKHCNGYTSTAIIIPYRDRLQHLLVFIRQIIPILRRQNLHYRIFVIEQNDKKGFNRGKLLNIGFSESFRLFPYSCVVFHDVDLIPEDDRIDYGCSRSPMHLSTAVSSFNYRLPYRLLFGGVEMLTPKDFRKLNGFSNLFYGWGGEDDDFSRRVRFSNMSIKRLSHSIARYTMLKHESVNRTAHLEKRIDTFFKVTEKHWKEDGLNSLQYQVNEVIEYKLYTLIKVDLLMDREESFGAELG